MMAVEFRVSFNSPRNKALMAERGVFMKYPGYARDAWLSSMRAVPTSGYSP